MPNARSMVYFNKQYLRSCDVPGFPPFDIPFPKDHVNFPRTISYIFFYLDYCLYYAIVLRPWGVLFETGACDHGTA